MTIRATRTDAEARRARIRDAASRCARLSGFHGASMAEIAQEAGLSVGQIYRYFQNKEAIIAAIVSQDVTEMRAKFAELEKSEKPPIDAVVENIVASMAKNCDTPRAALRLEVIAEAARNPCVASIVQDADAEERPLIQNFLERMSQPGGDERTLAARQEVLSMLFEGMMMRSVSNPGVDYEAISAVLRPVLRHLLVETAYDGVRPVSEKGGGSISL